MPWNESWNECRGIVVRCVRSGRPRGGVCAGSALGAAGRSSLNPRVRGSSPWRRTRPDLAFLSQEVVPAAHGVERVVSAGSLR